MWQNTIHNKEVGDSLISYSLKLLLKIDNGQDSGYQSNFGRLPYEETHFEEKEESIYVGVVNI